MAEFNQYRKLLTSTMMISTFAFGGGFVVISLMQKKFVDELKWIDEVEMLDMVTIAQSAPGIIAVNTSIILGKKLGGFKGSIVATLGTVLPPFIIISILSIFYEMFKNNYIISSTLQGMQAAIGAIIVCTAYSLFNNLSNDNKTYNYLLFAFAFVFSFFFKINVIYLIIGALLLSIVLFVLKRGDDK
ncbi:chromate transporter [Bacilli bacterium PM5-3]|nr:chromate transporter [Bacilli bacterium PM5-3]